MKLEVDDFGAVTRVEYRRKGRSGRLLTTTYKHDFRRPARAYVTTDGQYLIIKARIADGEIK